VVGTESLDKFEDYVSKVKSMNYGEMESIYLAAYDRYKQQLEQ